MSVEHSGGASVAGAEPSAGSVVSAALRICREHWATLAVYGLLAGVPVAALDAATALDRGIDPFATPLTGTGDPAAAGGASTVSAVLALILYAVASAATVHTVAAAHDGRRTGWQEGLGAGGRRMGGVVAASIIVLVLVVLGLLALILPGIWIAVALALTTPALVIERLAPLAAVRRSFTMVRGRWWPTAGVVGLTFLVAFGAVVAVSIPAGVLAAATDDRSLRALIAGVVNSLSTALLVPLTVGPMTVLFLERRAASRGDASGSEPTRYRGFAPPAAPERLAAPEPPASGPHREPPAG